MLEVSTSAILESWLERIPDNFRPLLFLLSFERIPDLFKVLPAAVARRTGTQKLSNYARCKLAFEPNSDLQAWLQSEGVRVQLSNLQQHF